MPFYMNGSNYKSIDLDPKSTARCNDVARMGFASEAPGWVVVEFVNSPGVQWYVDPGSIRLARGKSPPAPVPATRLKK